MKIENGQKGFTLTELVTVILILALLAIVAIPRYFEVRREARKSTILGIEAALQSAAALVKAQAKLEGKKRGTETTVTLEKVWGGTATVDVTEELVPKATRYGMGWGWETSASYGALQLPYFWVDPKFNLNTYIGGGEENTIRYAIGGIWTCSVEYRENNAGPWPPNGTVTITTTLTGC